MKYSDYIEIFCNSIKYTNSNLMNYYLIHLYGVFNKELQYSQRFILLFSFITQWYNFFTYYYFYLDFVNEGFVSAYKCYFYNNRFGQIFAIVKCLCYYLKFDSILTKTEEYVVKELTAINIESVTNQQIKERRERDMQKARKFVDRISQCCDLFELNQIKEELKNKLKKVELIANEVDFCNFNMETLFCDTKLSLDDYPNLKTKIEEYRNTVIPGRLIYLKEYTPICDDVINYIISDY